jgi:hypothetical protein
MITDSSQIIDPDHAVFIEESSERLIHAIIKKNWKEIYEILDTNEENFRDDFEKYLPEIQGIPISIIFQSTHLRVLHNIELMGLDQPEKPYFVGDYTAYYGFSNNLDMGLTFDLKEGRKSIGLRGFYREYGQVKNLVKKLMDAIIEQNYEEAALLTNQNRYPAEEIKALLDDCEGWDFTKPPELAYDCLELSHYSTGEYNCVFPIWTLDNGNTVQSWITAELSIDPKHDSEGSITLDIIGVM